MNIRGALQNLVATATWRREFERRSSKYKKKSL